jgi:hypothetical protein
MVIFHSYVSLPEGNFAEAINMEILHADDGDFPIGK